MTKAAIPQYNESICKKNWKRTESSSIEPVGRFLALSVQLWTQENLLVNYHRPFQDDVVVIVPVVVVVVL